jgi:pimeloyl-ACP methyl ester carboxylesterase
MHVLARDPDRFAAGLVIDPLGAIGDGRMAEFGTEIDRRVPAAGKARLAELNAQEERDGSLPTDLALEQLALYWPAYFPEPESAGASPMPLEASTESAAVTADARVDVVGGAGHFIWLDVPGAVRRSLDALAQRAL